MANGAISARNHQDRAKQRVERGQQSGDGFKAVHIIGGEQRSCGNRRQDVSRQLGAGDTEKDNRHNDPDKQEAGESVIGLRVRVDCHSDSGFARQRFHAFFAASISAGTANKVHGIVASRKTGM